MIKKTLYDSSKLRPFLITASLYMTAFELLKNAINKRIEDFFLIGYDCKNYNRHKEYDEEMKLYREKHKDKKDKKTYASLDWLVDFGAVTKVDIKVYDEVREFRNKIAHEMIGLTYENLPENQEMLNKHFVAMFDLLRKIEIYWTLNVDIPCNPDFDGKEIKADDVFPGPVLMMQMLCEEALGTTGSSLKASYYPK